MHLPSLVLTVSLTNKPTPIILRFSCRSLSYLHTDYPLARSWLCWCTLSVCGYVIPAFIKLTPIFAVWFRRDIARRFKTTLKDERDVHARLMLAYPEVPFWWFGAVFVICLLFLFTSIEIGKTGLPIWAALIALAFIFVLSLPVSMLMAITNQQVALQVIHEMVAGYMLPGRPVANVVYKTTANIGTISAVTFAGDMKLGHYMKIPPRIMFSIQIVATVIGCFVVTSVQNWMLSNIKDICTPQQADGFICAPSTTFAQGMLIWGGIGPKRIFSVGAP